MSNGPASVRGLESRAELDALHQTAALRACKRYEQNQALALHVWDGHHDLLHHHPLSGAVESDAADDDGNSSHHQAADVVSLQDHSLSAMAARWNDGPPSTATAAGRTGFGGRPGVQPAAGWLSSVPVLSAALLVSACCCQLPYELLNSSDRGCGGLVSVCEAVFGLVMTAPTALRLKSWAVPVWTHFWLAGAAVLYPLLLNQAMASPLPVVLLSTLKNGNLVANAVVGALLLGKRYTAVQVLSVCTVSAGLVVTVPTHLRPA